MASSHYNTDAGLEIKTRSVEQTLIPLVTQITTLINHKEKPKKSEKTLRAIQRVGQAVSLAVGRFVTVGEAIANENEELKEEMYFACQEARRAGECIAQLTDVGAFDQPESDTRATVYTDKTGMIKAARLLLSSVTKVLVLADRVVIKQIINSRSKVLATLEHLEKVSSFQEFVQIFSQFGNEMVEFAHLTGDRQNDLKDEKKKARMAAARAILEKCTMMLLTASKTCLRHPDCESARINKGGVFHRMRLALDQVIEIVTDSRQNGDNEIHPNSIYADIKEFKQCLKAKEATEDMELAIIKTQQCMSELRRELQNTAVESTGDLLRCYTEHVVLKALKVSGVEANLEALAECTCKLSEHKEQLAETSRLLRHVSGTEPLAITCLHAEETFQVVGPQIISAAQTLALHPSSKIAKENLDVFCEAWESQLNDMSILLKEINDVFEGRRGEKRAYLSLPRPGKHTANLKTVKAVKLDAEEQAKIAKLGLELRLHTSDVDAETERWEDQDNEILRQAQSMSSMAYSMYLFTRGEGLLKTTQDLFHQADIFAEEGLRFHASLHSLSNQLEEDEKAALMVEAERFPTLCQQLQMTSKTPVHGKAATFAKVDTSIQETKNVMTVLMKILSLCYKLLKKCQVDQTFMDSPHSWRGNQLQTVANGESLDGKNTDTFGVKSLERHMANLTFLESK
ncbi:alpha-catulin isoform X3 [Scyliorhinus torazame]|uniref:alpha-catulin isoform X3 n=1 Tax=Scyliorhinus torazame TaxID=75743 RepID=UPI003B5AE461